MHQAAKVDAISGKGVHRGFRSDEELKWLGNSIATIGRVPYFHLLFTQSLTQGCHVVATK